MSNAKCQIANIKIKCQMPMPMSGQITISCKISVDLVRSQYILRDLSRSYEISVDLVRFQKIL